MDSLEEVYSKARECKYMPVTTKYAVYDILKNKINLPPGKYEKAVRKLAKILKI